jgi:S-adenosylmethionine:tRNA ribosyltransferase-isomerase
MKTSDFDYDLPPGLIAQDPLPERSASRMLVFPRRGGEIEHRQVTDIVTYLRRGDLLVVNDTRVFPARIVGHRLDTGGRAELLLTHRVEDAGDGEVWEALMRSGFRPRTGMGLSMANGALVAEVLEPLSEGRVRVRLTGKAPLDDILDRHGQVPLPPYIKREEGDRARADADRERYQTVYARRRGAVAAPTAGLHFSDELMDVLKSVGVQVASVTLHVGPGTFRPVATDDPSAHEMDAEWYEVSPETSDLVAATRSAGNRVVAVGTTTVRTLETVAMEHGRVVPARGWSRLFIRSPFTFKAVDALLTNFHLPRSTLLMLVSAFCDGEQGDGRERVLAAYRAAVAGKYRFYSYGDCMLII